MTGCFFFGITTGNVTGADPLLGSLQNNGGLTFTHALRNGVLFSSPAIDAGGTAAFGFACLAKDQRGVTRPLDGNGDSIARCDIGAFEAATPSLLRTIGVPSLEPVETSIYAAEHVIYNFAWTVPGTSWRVLDNLQLRISDEQGVALWVYFQQVAGSQGTFSLIHPQTGVPGPAFAPGSRNRLETNAAVLHLAGSIVDGPPGSRVGLTLDLSFKPRAAGRTYQIEVMAVDSAGQQQDFTLAGLLTIH